MNQDKQIVAELAHAELISLHEQIQNLDKRYAYQYRLLQTHCQHVSETVEIKYYEGAPGHASRQVKIHTCDLCSKVLKYSNDENNGKHNA